MPEDSDIGLKIIRAAAQEGCVEAATYLFEGGFSVEVDNQEDTDGVTTNGILIFARDPSEQARDLYRKLSSGNESSGKKTAQILSFRKNSTEEIDRLMSREQESDE